MKDNQYFMAIEETIKPVPIIDLFAGPGGLGEGFSQFEELKTKRFKISLSIEKDKHAYNTLSLRSFFRKFQTGAVPDEYYSFLRGEIPLEELYRKYPAEYQEVLNETWNAELGNMNEELLDKKITEGIKGHKNWVLIGGPPCQAYSTAGRSRIRAIKGYVPEKDNRHFLYRQYLHIIANHWPSVFIMENVRGILSSKINGKLIFPQILEDLKDPGSVFDVLGEKKRYRIFSLVKKPVAYSSSGDPFYKKNADYIIECEKYGIPQARHRVILLGIREDCCKPPYNVLEKTPPVPTRKVLNGLPRLRSGFSREEDNKKKWLAWLDSAINMNWYDSLLEDSNTEDIAEQIFNENFWLTKPHKDRGGEFVPCKPKAGYLSQWYLDDRLGGVCNSATRGHLKSDLHRYFFVASFAKVRKKSPGLLDFPDELLPNHKNASKQALKKSIFTDRFRVQLKNKPSTTIMSHISKDGHYYIHYDPTQCRSLTVREAARLQTFPDNYFFCGPRTQQYVQVGNAVPPFLALQIAEIVCGIVSNNGLDERLDGYVDEGETKLEYVQD